MTQAKETEVPLLREAEDIARNYPCPETNRILLLNAVRAFFFIAKRKPSESELFILRGNIQRLKDEDRRPGAGEKIASELAKSLKTN